MLSPDGKREAFIRDWNLWVRDVATGKETQLTTDGVENFGYATNNAGWVHDDSAILVWSPDSSKIATFQQDQRKTSTMALVGTNVGAPKIETWKYPFVGDKDVTMIERVVIDVPTQKVVRLKMPPDQHRSTQCDDVSCFGGWEDVQWAKDGKSIAFVSTSRDHTKTSVRTADVATGAVRDVFDESAKNWFEIRHQRHQLALPAGEQRDPVVEPAQQLGPPVPVRPRHRQAEAPGDRRRLERRRSAAPGPGVAHGVVHRREPRSRATTRTTSTCTRRTSMAATPVLLSPEDAQHTLQAVG